MAATFTIVALAYTFYVGSMWMLLVYPECPYQHPISKQLRLWMTRSAEWAVGVREPQIFCTSESTSEKAIARVLLTRVRII
jgi:hypothetical protein